MTLARTAIGKGAPGKMGDTIIRSPHGNVGFASNIGRVRPVDEDSVLAVEIRTAFLSEPRTRLLLMVADGMGGHSRGEVASRIAVQAVARTLLPPLASETSILPAVYPHEHQTAVGTATKT